MKVAVTGASGHIGAEVCRQLLDQGFEVKALVHEYTESLDGLPVELVRGSILNKASLKELLSEADAVVHTAGLISLGHRPDPQIYDVNFIGTKNLLEVAEGILLKKFVHFSSIHVYRQLPKDLPLDENREFVSDEALFYGRTKRDAHRLVLQYGQGGMNVSVLCPTSVLGPGDYRPSKLGKAIVDICKGKIPAVVRGGFDFVDVRDVASAALAALERKKSGETYIIGGHYHTISDFADRVLKFAGKPKHLPELPMWMAYLGLPFVQAYAAMTQSEPLYDGVYLEILKEGNLNISSEKARRELGFSPRDLNETLRDTIAWFRKHGKLD